MKAAWHGFLGIQSPTQMDGPADRLQQKGPPERIVDRVRPADQGRFEHAQEVLSNAMSQERCRSSHA